MAKIKAIASLAIQSLVIFLLFAFAPTYSENTVRECKFDLIYQLGDSISDTGNLIRENPMFICGRLPYGQDFPNHESTGRCSNGLLMIDYFALSAGMPLLDAYLNPKGIFGHGVNFAVAGATALPVEVLLSKGIIDPLTNSSLSIQLDWMFTYFNSTCYNPKDCEETLKDALFMVGEIGGNDYNYAFFENKTINEVKSIVPDVVKAIIDAVKRVIGFGARRVVVPGNFPIGCFPIYLDGFQSNDTNAYDELHCLKGLNNFSIYHNDHLKTALKELKKEFANVSILYADYYNTFLWILRHARYLGFDENSALKSCCGIGGKYDFTLSRVCGNIGVPVCADPNQRISWDGIHLTQKAYEYMSSWLIHDIYLELRCI